MQESNSKIVVVVRKRPISKKEQSKGETDIVEIKEFNQISVREIKQKLDLTKYIEEHQFTFDMAFDQNTTNEAIYVSTVRPIIEAAFNKAKVTCFAYGQTGSGKTYTMIGDQEKGIPGLYLLASYDIFSFLEKPQFLNLQVSISFYEIYCGKLFDLLNERNQLQAREDAKGNVNIVGLAEKKVATVQNLMQIIEQGQSVRVTSCNSANAESSRSHALLQIILKNGKHVHGKLSFIDLAGSERGADVQDQNKQTRIDGAEINKSLLALKECIRALDQNKNHTPFRGSKLTLVLKDSFMGNCRTVMIGNISPNSSSSEHTLNTLRYSDRVKELRKPGQEPGPPQQLSQLDMLAKELMLPRQQKNVIKLPFKNEDDGDDEEDLVPQQMPKMQRQINSVGVPQQRNIQQKQLSGNNNHGYPQQDFQQLYQQQQEPTLNSFIKPVPKPTKNEAFDQFPLPQKHQQPQHPYTYAKPETNGDGQNQLQMLSQQHENLIQQILNEEEEVVNSHRLHIDQMVEMTKQEMLLLNQVDQPGSDINDYVKKLQKIMEQKMQQIGTIKQNLDSFAQHLLQEEMLSKQFYDQRKQMLETLDGQEQTGDDIELLQDLEQ